MALKIYRNILTNICTNKKLYSTKSFKTHYDVLNLKRSCTPKEIKDSYIKLSKQYHPDINKGTDAQAKFVQIVQAYDVLSKPHLRRLYDTKLVNSHIHSKRHHYVYTDQSSGSGWDDPSFYENRDKSQDFKYENEPYYGIKGVKKVSNTVVVVICLFVAAFGLFVQLLAVKHSFTLRREVLNRKSEEAGAILREIQLQAAANGNELQLQIFKEKYRAAGGYGEFSDDD